jgi:hypothetical protein
MRDTGEHGSWTRGIYLGAALALALGCSREVILGSLPDQRGSGGDAGAAGGGGAGAMPAARCPSGGAPTLTTLASGLQTAVFDHHPGIPLFLRGDTVYFATPTAVLTVPVAGGPTTTLTTEPDPFHGAWPSDLQVDATTVYVATDTGIVTMAATGGAMTQLVSEAVMNAQIAVDAEGVYWVGVRPCTAADGCNNNVGEVKRVPLGGGTTTVLGSDLGTQSGGRSYGGLVVDDASVYWVEESSGWVMKLPLAGGAATVIAQLQVLTTALASDAHNVY